MIPQLIYLGLMAIGIGMEIARHGTEKTGKHNAWSQTIAATLILAVLWWGGFFDPLLGGVK